MNKSFDVKSICSLIQKASNISQTNE